MAIDWATIGLAESMLLWWTLATRVGVHVADYDLLLGVADVPELAVGEAVELDATGEAVRIEVVEVDDPGHGAPVARSISQQERARLASAAPSTSQLGDHRIPVGPAHAQQRRAGL